MQVTWSFHAQIRKTKNTQKKNIACVLYKHVHVLYMYIVHLCSFIVCINRNNYMKFHDICVGFKIYDFEISRGARKPVARDSEYVPEIELYTGMIAAAKI